MPETRGKSLEEIDASFRGKKLDVVDLGLLQVDHFDGPPGSKENPRNAQTSSLLV